MDDALRLGRVASGARTNGCRSCALENAFLYGGHDSAVCALAKQGIALWMLGFPDQALACAEEAVARARALGHPPSLMHALTHAVVVHYLRGDHRSHRVKTEELSRIAGEGLARWVPFSNLQILYLQAIGGETDLAERMPMLRDALAAELAGDVEKTGFCVSLFCEVCRRAGELDEGLSAAQAAIKEAVRTGVRIWEPELRRIAGEFLRSLSPPKIEESAATFREALRTARQQGALSLQLRAAASLATLPAGDGQKSEGVELLAAVYARFTEGLNTPDLVTAKHLLDLSGHGG
jgi:predicted ATPase